MSFLSSEEKDILQLVPEAVYMVDKNFNLRFLNKQAEYLLGYEMEEAAGKKCYEVFGKRDGCGDSCPLNKILHSPVRTSSYRVKLQPRSSDPIPLIFKGKPYIKDGDIAGYLVFLTKPFSPAGESEKTTDKTYEEIAQTVSSRINIRDIFELEELEKMVSTFAEIHGVTSAIFDEKMELLTNAYNFSESCWMVRSTEKGLEKCLCSDERLLQAARENSPATLKCSSAGLMDAVAPIMVAGKRVGTWALGQVMIEEEFPEEHFRDYAEEIGIDPDEYVLALRRQTRMPMSRLQKLAEFLVQLTNMLGRMGMQRLILDSFQQQMIREKDLLHATLANIGDGVITVDNSGNILFFNNVAAQLNGWDTAEVVGAPLVEVVRLVHPEYRDDLSVEEKEQFFFGSPPVELATLFPILKSREGTEHRIAISASSLAGQGHKIGWVVVLHDMTERKKMEEELHQAQKMEAIGTLAGGIAHDFNNMLNAILGFSELSRMDLKEGSELYDNQQRIIEAAQRASEMVQQILTFSRKTDQGKNPVSLQPLIKESLRFLRNSLPSTIAIKEVIDPEVRAVIANATRINQTLMNLCTNAKHAMLKKGGLLRITLDEVFFEAGRNTLLGELPPGAYARLIVEDTGCGMDEQTKMRIFEPYFTTKRVGEGTGMGLATVHGIVKEHQGGLDVTSKPGRGTVFTLYFPVTGGRSSRSPKADSRITVSKKNGRVMVVDDETLILDVMSRILKNMNCQVYTFHDSREALMAFRDNPNGFDLLFTDQTMPGLTGFELTKKFLAIRPEFPIILSTGYSETVDEKEAYKIGIRRFLMKPLAVTEVSRAISALLEEMDDRR